MSDKAITIDGKYPVKLTPFAGRQANKLILGGQTTVNTVNIIGEVRLPPGFDVVVEDRLADGQPEQCHYTLSNELTNKITEQYKGILRSAYTARSDNKPPHKVNMTFTMKLEGGINTEITDIDSDGNPENIAILYKGSDDFICRKGKSLVANAVTKSPFYNRDNTRTYKQR